MTREEAERAAATFEFPPFRAEVLRTWIFDPDDLMDRKKTGYHIWELDIFEGANHLRCFETPAEWLAYYAAWQRTQAGGGGVPAPGQNDGDEFGDSGA